MGDFSVLALRIKELRKSLNMTQKDFSAHVGCTAATLSAYENGSKSPSLEIIKSIAAKCNVSIDWLCGLSDKKTSSNIPHTLADIFEMLFLIQEYSDIRIYNHKDVVYIRNADNLLTNFGESTIHAMGFQPFDIDSFMEDWQKMYEMYQSEKIDEEVYALWKEKTLIKTMAYLPNGEKIRKDESRQGNPLMSILKPTAPPQE